MTIPTLVYIVCRGHSGSTLLELLLNKSDNIAAMGEIDLFPIQVYRDHHTRWVGTCSCGERPVDCAVWGPIIAAIDQEYKISLAEDPMNWRISNFGLEEEYRWRRPRQMVGYLLRRQLREIGGRHDIPLPGRLIEPFREWVRRRDFLYKQFARTQQVRGIVDSSKDPQQMLDLYKYSGLRVKILFLTRDVRGPVWSAFRWGRSSVEFEAHQWSRLNKRIMATLACVDPASQMRVHYEDICRDPDAELARIHEFIGLPRNEVDADTEKENRHTIAGNRTRFRLLEQVRLDEAWRENLTRPQIETVKRIAGATASELGYDFS